MGRAGAKPQTVERLPQIRPSASVQAESSMVMSGSQLTSYWSVPSPAMMTTASGAMPAQAQSLARSLRMPMTWSTGMTPPSLPPPQTSGVPSPSESMSASLVKMPEASGRTSASIWACLMVTSSVRRPGIGMVRGKSPGPALSVLLSISADSNLMSGLPSAASEVGCTWKMPSPALRAVSQAWSPEPSPSTSLVPR